MQFSIFLTKNWTENNHELAKNYSPTDSESSDNHKKHIFISKGPMK